MALTQVPSSQIADGAVTTTKLADLGITTQKLADGVVSPAKLAQPFSQGAAQATVSGTVIDFTGIPSWAKRITIQLLGVSTNGTSPLCVQGGSGSVVNTGYNSFSTAVEGAATSTANATAGLAFEPGRDAAQVSTGAMVLTLLSGNQWVASHTVGVSGSTNPRVVSGAGSTPAFAGALDRIRLTTIGGTDTFDAGSVNILYEG